MFNSTNVGSEIQPNEVILEELKKERKRTKDLEQQIKELKDKQNNDLTALPTISRKDDEADRYWFAYEAFITYNVHCIAYKNILGCKMKSNN